MHRSAIDYWPIFVPTLALPPFSESERVEREARNQQAKEHLKTVLSYALDQMRTETNSGGRWDVFTITSLLPVTRKTRILVTDVPYQSHKVGNAIADYAHYEVQAPVQMQHCGRVGESVWDVFMSAELIGHIRFLPGGNDLWVIDQVCVSDQKRTLLDKVGDALIVRLKDLGLLGTLSDELLRTQDTRIGQVKQLHNQLSTITVALNRHDAYHHLFILCQNEKDFAISDYHKDYREGDYDRIVISDIEMIEKQHGEVAGAIIGTIRLLPIGDRTAIMFVDKDALHRLPIPVGGAELFTKYIQRIREHFAYLGLIVSDTHDQLDTTALVSGSQGMQLLHQQLAETRENLLLIEERKAQYVQEVDIPLQLIKEERRLKEQIAEIERKLGSSSYSEKEG